MKIKYITICLILFFCVMGIVSATENVSTEDIYTTVDTNTNTIQIDSNDNLSSTIEDSNEKAILEDKQISTNNVKEGVGKEKSQNNHQDNLQLIDDSIDKLRYYGEEVEAYDWVDLASFSHDYQGSSNFVITLTGEEYEIGDSINITSPVTIIGNSECYISGYSSECVFYNDNDCVINFVNVTFKNINSNVFMKLFSSYMNTFENCTFINITTFNSTDIMDHSSVIWNCGGFMNITNCNFINCTNGFGVVTNHVNTTLGVDMAVNNCNFINNHARIEPGAINNCGNLTVSNSNFTNNTANWWAGAIHTHNNANTIIYSCNFSNNFAGWNGGALYTYSNLSVYNSNFINNSCNRSAGGGAIGASNNGEIYNIYVCECNFENNLNICNLTNETPSLSNGGAISSLNTGILEVVGSNFTNNFASKGQAISAYSEVYPNLTYGMPTVRIAYNTFNNHTNAISDTVSLDGEYIFEHNTFNNCNQFNRNGYANEYNNCNPLNIQSFNMELLGASSLNEEILGDGSTSHDKPALYFNLTIPRYTYQKSNNTGQSWEEAYSRQSPQGAISNQLINNGTVYVWGIVNDTPIFNVVTKINTTFIGFNNETVFGLEVSSKDGDYVNKFINMTFIKIGSTGVKLCGNAEFINCTFLDVPILFSGSPKEQICTKFYNCQFINHEDQQNSSYLLSNSIQSILIEFYDCLFENITTDSIITAPYLFDGVSISNSTFKNCSVKGILDFSGDNDIEASYSIENCDYDFKVTLGEISSEDNLHTYINATKLKSFVGINSTEKGSITITLTDSNGDAISGASVKYSINDGDELSNVTDGDGKFVISGLNGVVNISANYLGNESFNANDSSDLFDFKLNSKIAITNESKVVIITLTDENNNAISGATVKYSIDNGEELSNTTDSNGQFKIFGLTGVVNISANYLGNESYNANDSSDLFDFKLNSKIAITNESKVVIITLTDENNNAISGVTVKYSIDNGEELSNTTDSNGQIKISSLSDEFDIKVIYSGNGTFNENVTSQKFNFTKITHDNNETSTNSTGNTTSGNGTSTNSTGNTTSGNGTSTNSTGNTTSGNGTSTTSGKTNTNTNKQTTAIVTKKATKITAKKATFKANVKIKKYTITLKGANKALKKVKVTLKVGKKTFKATTNNKGKATFKINNLKKKGRYAAIIKFAGNKSYKASSVKVIITVKK